jgi:hypothetical protein
MVIDFVRHFRGSSLFFVRCGRILVSSEREFREGFAVCIGVGRRRGCAGSGSRRKRRSEGRARRRVRAKARGPGQAVKGEWGSAMFLDGRFGGCDGRVIKDRQDFGLVLLST